MSTFPADPLPLKYELLLNGTWTDISQYVYQRDDQVITRARQNESATIQPTSLTCTLNNRDGRFSPKNSDGAYYPYIGRNTQIRVSVDAESASSVTYSGYRFWGEVSSWPPQWDLSGSDVWVSIQAGGILRRYVQGRLLGSALRRFYMLKTDATTPVSYWPCEEGTTAAQFGNLITPGDDITWTGTPQIASDTNFAGSDPIPLIANSAWTGTTGSFSLTSPQTYTTPGTHTFTAPGGTTTVTAACWGAGGGGGGVSDGGGGGGEYASQSSVAVTPGTGYTVTVGAGGASGSAGGNSSFAGDAATVTAHGGSSTSSSSGGTGGTGSSNTTHHNGGTGGAGGTGTGGGGGGSSAGTAAAGNTGTAASGTTGGAGGTAVTGGGAGGAGGNFEPPGVHNGTAGATPGGGGGGSGNGGVGGNGAAGKVTLTFTSSSTPAHVVLRFLLDIPPDTASANGATLVRGDIASGTLSKIECYYVTANGGSLGIRGFNTSSTKVFDSTGTGITNANGVQLVVSLELATSGTGIAWAIKAVEPGGSSLFGSSNSTLASSTIGAMSQVLVGPNSDVNDTGVGHIVVQYAVEDMITSGLADAANGHDGELAADRFTRLCTEENFTGTLIGTDTDTPQMGPQTDQKFTDLLQEIEDCDQGQLIEARDMLGMYYRTRVDLQNQSAGATFNYTDAVLADGLQPAYDDQLTRNDITVSRPNGSTATMVLTSGALSNLDPPDGVGDYTYTPSINVHADSQLADLAQWILDVGTVDEYRYPQVSVDLSRSECAASGLFDDVPALDVGDYFQITNPPSWVPESPVKQLCWGFTEYLNAFTWKIVINAVPESPYEGVDLPSW